MKSEHVHRHKAGLSTTEREALLKQKGCVVWLTGLSGSGKSTIAYALEKQLISQGAFAYVLDGDNVRHGLNGDLGFTDSDREENIRRVSEVAALFCEAGCMTMVSFISPFAAGRAFARSRVEAGRFIEVFLDVSLATCEKRDPKGLYQKVREGKIQDCTGIDSPYENPEHPEVSIQTASCSVEDAVARIADRLRGIE